jgi:hypothetical protein
LLLQLLLDTTSCVLCSVLPRWRRLSVLVECKDQARAGRLCLLLSVGGATTSPCSLQPPHTQPPPWLASQAWAARARAHTHTHTHTRTHTHTCPHTHTHTHTHTTQRAVSQANKLGAHHHHLHRRLHRGSQSAALSLCSHNKPALSTAAATGCGTMDYQHPCPPPLSGASQPPCACGCVT